MTFDTNITKIVILFVLGMIFFARTMFKSEPVIISRSFVLAVVAFSLIVLHYFIFGISNSSENNEQLFAGLAIIILAFWISNDLRQWSALESAVAIFRFFAVIFVLVNLPWAASGGGDSYIEGNYIGVTSNANILGGYLALCCFPLLLHGLMDSDGRKSKIFYAVIILACCYLIILTRSRGALLSVGAASAFAVVTANKLNYSLKILFVSVVIAATAAVLIQASSKYLDVGISGTRDPLLNQRLTAISERPWTGWGFNSDVYSFYYEENAFPAMEKGNTVLQIIEEFGLPFGLFVAAGVLYIFWRAATRLRSLPIGLAIAATLIGSLAHLMVETWLFNFQSLLSIYIWIILLIYLQLQQSGLRRSA